MLVMITAHVAHAWNPIFNNWFSVNFPNKSVDCIYWIVKATTAANIFIRITIIFRSLAAGIAYVVFLRNFLDLFIFLFLVKTTRVTATRRC